MKIEEVIQKDFPQIIEIYNNANKIFWHIYSDEEKIAFTDSSTLSQEQLEDNLLTKKIICSKDSMDNITGYAVFRKKNDTTVWISSLYIDPLLQRKGVGQELLMYIEKFAKENNCIIVALETHRDAVWAIKFYEKNGFDIVNEKLSEYPYNTILDKPAVLNRPILVKIISL